MDNFVFRNITAETIKLGLKQEEVANKLGITSRALRNKLQRIRPFTSEELFKLVKITGKPMDYLMEVYETKKGA